MIMLGHFLNRHRVSGLTGFLAKREPSTEVDRHLAAKIRQRECGLTIAAVRRPQEREKRLVLIDGQELSVRQRPPLGGEGEGHYADFREEWGRHTEELGARLSWLCFGWFGLDGTLAGDGNRLLESLEGT